MLSRKEISESKIFVRRDGSYAIWDKKNLCFKDAPIPIYQEIYLFKCFICGQDIHHPERYFIHSVVYPPELIWCCKCRGVWAHYNKYKEKYDIFVLQQGLK